MKAVIQLDVPNWQIGQDVTVYFPDTMMKHAKCELLKEQEAVVPRNTYSTTPSGKVIPHIFCGKCNKEIYAIYAFCSHCGRKVKWE